MSSPLRTNKKFYLYLFSHATVIRRQRYSGDASRLRQGFGGQAILNSDQWEHARLEELGRALVKKTGWSAKDLFMTLRVAITGKTATPPLFETMEILGREKTLGRIRNTIKKLR